jgi:hypothetical protein
LRRSGRVSLVRFHPLSVIEKGTNRAGSIIGHPSFAEIGGNIHRNVTEGEVDEVDLVRELAHDLMTVATALARQCSLRGCRRVRRHSERLLDVIGLKKVAVAREDKALRRRLVSNVPWRTRRCVWRPGTAELSRREGVSIHDDRGLAAEALVVDEGGW